MTSYVLIHGAWHDGSAWDNVRRILQTRGYDVHTPTAGGLRNGDPSDIGLIEACEPIERYIVENDLNDFVLLGHSWGGFLIAKLAESLYDRIRRLVFQNAFIPLDGQCVFDNTPPFFRPTLVGLAETRGDGRVVMPFEVWRDGFMNDASLELARHVYERLKPQPIRTFTEPAELKTFYKLTIPKSYINSLDDNGLLQGEWGWHPRMSNRLGYFRLVQLPGGHEVMFTNPELLATKIEEAGRD
jgi:pimeloyl-ACP methyl ester carboxylesterase